MRPITIIALVGVTVLSVLTYLEVGSISLLWMANLYSATLGLAIVSASATALRALFVSAATAHIALFSFAVGTLAFAALGLSPYPISLFANVAIILLYAWAVGRGVREDVATSVAVGATTSCSVIVLHQLYVKAGFAGRVYAAILGDPLVVDPTSALLSALTALLVALFVFSYWKKLVLVGLDQDFARSIGVRVSAYTLLFHAVLAVSGITYIRSVGYIMLHALLLLPGSVAVLLARSSQEVPFLSVTLATLATASSLALSVTLGVSPAGLVGVIMLAMYVSARATQRR